MTCKNAAIQVQIQSPNGLPIKKVFLLLFTILSGFAGSGQDRQGVWVDSIFRTMTVAEKIGQLFMVSSSAALSKNASAALDDDLKSLHFGSILISGGGPQSTAHLLNKLNKLSKVPLLAAIAAPNGLGQTLDSTMQFLSAMSVGAIANDSMVFRLGRTIGTQMKVLGLNINFGPNISIWQRQGNYRNYIADDKLIVEKISVGLLRGLHSAGILVCPQQFPRIPGRAADGKDSVQLYEPGLTDSPGKSGLLRAGADGLVTTQFPFSVVEDKRVLSAAISASFVHDVLEKQLAFGGLAFCDISVLMKIPAKKRKKGEAELSAIMAGNDVLFNCPNIAVATRFFLKALKKNKQLMPEIDGSVKKILTAKFNAGLSKKNVINTDNLSLKLNLPEDRLFRHQLAENSVTVVRNSGVVPVRTLEDRNFSYLALGSSSFDEFGHYLSKYNGVEKTAVGQLKDTAGMVARFKNSDVIIVGIFPAAESFQLQLLPALQGLASQKQVIICLFGNPAGIRNFAGFPTLIAACDDDLLLQKMAAQIIFGGMGAKGKLPLTINNDLRSGHGVITKALDRLSYTLPEGAGMDSRMLEQMKAIADEAINMKATPGIEVLIARNGKVISEESYGFLTYDKTSPVTDETIYDLASVTKVSATLQTVMFMYEKGLIDINKKASVYLPELKNSNKEDFTIKDILAHQAGLWPFLPFWAQTVKDTLHLPEFYSRNASAGYPFAVAPHMYASKGMRDSLWQWIITSKIQEKNHRIPYDYKYSDMGFYIMQHLAERLLNQPMDEFLQQNFYDVLGASTTGFLPLLRFPPTRIAPTEDDKLFRRSLLIGYVHDQGAAMSGGIAGHAGLFSTANDLAKLGQMWLQGGSYGGHRFFKPQTIDLFTKRQFENSRRGLGWDKPVISDPNGPTSAYASARTFGHTGFTGISIWIDPEFDLVFIFLSNRVYPEMTNNKILNANIRPRVQDIVYRSIFKYCENHN